jgi:hypothetical protein
LFDLRHKKENIIRDTLICYNFLGPSWFREYYLDHTELNLAYLIIDSKYYEKLIPNEVAWEEFGKTRKYEHNIPKTECWFPEEIPINFVNKVVLVRVYESASPGNTLSYAHHMLALKERTFYQSNV